MSTPNKKNFIGKTVLLVILLLGLIPIFWFKKDYFIAGGDGFSLLNPGTFADAFKYVWNEKLPNAGGMILSVPRLIPMIYFWTSLSSLGVPLLFIERLWILLLFALPGFSMYFLMSKIYNRPLAKLISSVFYTFNLFVLVSGPFHDNLRPVFIALPLMLAFWIKGLQSEGRGFLKYVFLIGLTSLIYSNANVNPPTVIVIPLTLLFYLLFHCLAQRKITRNNLLFLFSTIIFYLLLNSWWLLNFLFGIIQETGGIRKVATFTALGTGGITDFFRLLGSWGWRAEHYRMPYYPYARFYDEPILLFLSFLIPLLVFVTLLFKRSEFKVGFFGFLALAGLFLSKGTAEPLGFIYRWLWENVPGFWVFREPFSKFSPVTMFAYSVLIGLAVDFVYLKITSLRIMHRIWLRILLSIFLPVSLVSTFLAVAYPLVTGEFIWNYWNGSVRSYYVKIPDYWKEIKEWLSKTDSDQRIFLTPRGGYGVAYNWPSGFSTADAPGIILLDNPVLRMSSPMSSADGVVGISYGSMRLGNPREFRRLLSLLNVRYVLQENDLDWRFTGAALPPSESNSFLSSNGFRKVKEFGYFSPEYLSSLSNEETRKFLRDALGRELTGQPALVLYEVAAEDNLPRFYVPEKIIYSSGYLDALQSVVSLEEFPLRSAIYLSSTANLSHNPDKQLIEEPDYIFVKPEKIEFVEDTRLSMEDEEKFVLPKTSILPDSPLYFLIKWREDQAIKRQKEKIPRTDILLWLSTKRLLEIEKMIGFGRYGAVGETFERYLRQIKEVVENLQVLSREQANSYPLAAKANLFFAKHKDMLERLRGGLPTADSEQKITGVYELFRKVSFIVSSRNSQFYLVNKPKEGYYKLLVRKESGFTNAYSESFLNQIDIVLDKEETSTLSGRKINDGWYEYPEIFFLFGAARSLLPVDSQGADHRR